MLYKIYHINLCIWCIIYIKMILITIIFNRKTSKTNAQQLTYTSVTYVWCVMKLLYGHLNCFWKSFNDMEKNVPGIILRVRTRTETLHIVRSQFLWLKMYTNSGYIGVVRIQVNFCFTSKFFCNLKISYNNNI